MIALAQTLVSWLGVFVAGGGAVLSALHLSRSRWAMVLCGGFAIETVVLVFYRVGTAFARNGIFDVRMLSAAFLAASVVGLFARAGVVAGAIGVLTEASRSSSSPAAQSPAAPA